MDPMLGTTELYQPAVLRTCFSEYVCKHVLYSCFAIRDKSALPVTLEILETQDYRELPELLVPLELKVHPASREREESLETRDLWEYLAPR